VSEEIAGLAMDAELIVQRFARIAPTLGDRGVDAFRAHADMTLANLRGAARELRALSAALSSPDSKGMTK